ncbi:MAG TPA: delta-60 repeat domain-containing protein, partial [Pyrinomonadaceae bacterium]|nr:delta-60 repeat domain-containing protein [Pyrinomonadaceae bacterium]
MLTRVKSVFFLWVDQREVLRLSLALIFSFAASHAVLASGVDDGFDPNANGTINVVRIRPDNRIMIAGDFTSVGGATRTRVAALWNYGGIDVDFADPNVNGNVVTMAIQADNKIWIGGSFTQVGGVDHPNIARLLPNGAVEGVFTTPNGSITSMALQPDGKLIIGGNFTMIGS